MSFLEFATLYNLLSVATAFLISVLVAQKYPSDFFPIWTKAYASSFFLLLLELASARFGRNIAINATEIALVLTVAWFYFQTGLCLTGRSLPRHWYKVLLPTLCTLAVLAMNGGISYIAIIALLIPLFSGSMIWAGAQFIRRSNVAKLGPGGRWLGWPLVFCGVWNLSYPIFISFTAAWTGYMVAGVLNQLIGTGIAVFLVEQTTHQLRTRNASLEEVNDLKTTFIRTMSHELRTPLSSINTATYLMTSSGPEVLSEQQSEFMAIIKDAGELLSRIVFDILDFTRMESGAMSYEYHPENLAEIVAGTARGHIRQFEAKGIQLIVSIPEEPVQMLLDRARLTQVINNLLVNARKFTQAGGTVTLSLQQHLNFAQIEVQDSGIGIAATEHEKIFERFYQIESKANRHSGGLGLGLSIARSIIEDGHGGTLKVESRLGEGSRFIVSLPLEPVPPLDDPAQAAKGNLTTFTGRSSP